MMIGVWWKMTISIDFRCFKVSTIVKDLRGSIVFAFVYFVLCKIYSKSIIKQWRIQNGGGQPLSLGQKPIITARKRSLRRLCFYRCVSVNGGGGGWWCLLPGGSGGDPPKFFFAFFFAFSRPPFSTLWSMSGRYASYWNAFLFDKIFAENCMKRKEIGQGASPAPHPVDPPMTEHQQKLV